MNSLKLITLTIVLGFLVGCSSIWLGNDESREPEMGVAYNDLMKRQTANPNRQPKGEPATQDGQKAVNSLEAYRADGGQPADVGKEIHVNIGQ